MDWKGIFFGIMLLFFSLVFISPQGESQQSGLPAPELTVRIYENSYTSEHFMSGDVSKQKMEVEGDINFEFPENTPPSTECEFEIWIESGSFPDETPMKYRFDNKSKYGTFSFTSFIEGFHPMGQKYDFELKGTWSYAEGLGTGEIEPISGKITISPYTRIRIDIEDECRNLDLTGGYRRELYIDLVNLGNAEDTFTIEEKGFTPYVELELIGTKFTLRPYETGTCILRIKVLHNDPLNEKLVLLVKGRYDNFDNEEELEILLSASYVQDEYEMVVGILPLMLTMGGIALTIIAVVFILHRYEKRKEKQFMEKRTRDHRTR